MANSDYWDRVWIILEIVKARKITICFGDHLLTWDSLITNVLSCRLPSGCGPRRFDVMLSAKYDEGRKLCSLIRSHRNAKSSNPRDKVYALLGLAVDADDFPISYSKTLLTVWQDVVGFMSEKSLLPFEERIPFAVMMKDMLADGTVGVENQSLKDIQDRDMYPIVFHGTLDRDDINYTDDCYPFRSFKTMATFDTTIKVIGPSLKTFMSDLKVVETWTTHIIQHFESETSPAIKENDLFTQALEKFDDNDSRIINFQSPSKSFQENRLVLVEDGNGPKGRWRIGLAPQDAEIGDRIYWIKSICNPILIRHGSSSTKRPLIIGTALVSVELVHNGYVGSGAPVIIRDENSILCFDVATLFALLS